MSDISNVDLGVVKQLSYILRLDSINSDAIWIFKLQSRVALADENLTTKCLIKLDELLMTKK